MGSMSEWGCRCDPRHALAACSPGVPQRPHCPHCHVLPLQHQMSSVYWQSAQHRVRPWHPQGEGVRWLRETIIRKPRGPCHLRPNYYVYFQFFSSTTTDYLCHDFQKMH
jgi:hypothetical protein